MSPPCLIAVNHETGDYPYFLSFILRLSASATSLHLYTNATHPTRYSNHNKNIDQTKKGVVCNIHKNIAVGLRVVGVHVCHPRKREPSRSFATEMPLNEVQHTTHRNYD